uniref:Uncharacterized protein n=1 Tax=Anguilla anguilla TaxID=7936 RepID=A0A0E9VZC2_ANGAN
MIGHQSTQRKPMLMWREHAISTQRGSNRPGLAPRTSFSSGDSANHCTPTQSHYLRVNY